ncbi:odorant receptor 59a-like [Drosophila sulfurigaster albostrigata]|uniref:odorant receptor 59a-like n=1 Tax=Drosophila sulfurigaster albostrigata TaxID=89887 RepID=UPI002D218CC0|nr:odorant receptor 59a-like [Drosophila sulfurigaster albostrigata]
MIINSLSYFRSHWTIWTILGVAYKEARWQKLYLINTLMVFLLVSIGYPLHLGLSVFKNDTLADDLKNLTTFVTCLACSIKVTIITFNFDKVYEMQELLKLLDARVSGKDETYIYSQLRAQLRNILIIFITFYIPIAIFAEMSFIYQEERGLMYPAWFPLDWKNSTRNYYIANIYQIVGVSYQLMQNYCSDCFPAVMLCIISSHTKMLYKRFEKIGVKETDDAANQRELEDCITDHKRLIELFRKMESFMSLPMLIQIAVTAVSICVSFAGFIFFVTEPMNRAYFFFYGIAMPLQIFPTCYYGTDTELWFGKIHYAAFSCDWVNQSRSFKKKLMLFVECSLKQNTAMAGGMVRIHVATFFSVLKFAYSLFTILLRMGK